MQTTPCGRVYAWIIHPVNPLGGRVTLSMEPLPRLDSKRENGLPLSGRYVVVRNGGAVNEPDPVTGGVRALAIENAKPSAEGNFFFEPGRGGGRIDKVLLAEPDFRSRYIEASHFGEVNTYFHLDRVGAYIDSLLHELHLPSLPRLLAVVNAHHAATECNGLRDGVRSRRSGRWLPFQGGHYRLPSWRYDVSELQPLLPTGEIHLGPGWQLLRAGAIVDATGGSYWHNAAHNAAILYHEYGHHIMRHTADVRANSLRPLEKQSNRKPAIEEGTCDYWTAAMLGTPHIWAWHRRHDEEEIHPRSLSSSKTMADYDLSPEADPHLNGTIWGAALWDLRAQFGRNLPDGFRCADLLVLKALSELGRIAAPPGEAGVKYLCRVRASYEAGFAALLRADEVLNAGRNRETIRACFGKRGIRESSFNLHQGELLEVSPH